MTPPSCPGCGLVAPPGEGTADPSLGASPACRSLYARVVAAEYADPERWPVHPLTVDAYGAQHPGTPSRKAARSVGVHLVTLHLALEKGLAPDRTTVVRTAVGDRISAGMTWLQPPATAAALTVADVAGARDAADHRVRVRAWAEAVWAAWAEHHETVRLWSDWLAAASPPTPSTGSPHGPA